MGTEHTADDASDGGPDTESLADADVLVVEDSPGEIRLIRDAFDRFDRSIVAVRDGDSALSAIRGLDAVDGGPRLILLDLKLPGRSGLEVLEAVEDDPVVRHRPVVVLTNSRNSDDIVRAYEVNANAYLVKPTNYDEFEGLIAAVERFWLQSVALP